MAKVINQNVKRFRYFVCFAIWFTLNASYTERLNLSVSIVGMISNRKAKNSSDEGCPSPVNEGLSEIHQKTKKYDWNSYDRNILLLGYNVGYFVNHVFGAILAQSFGCRITLSICIAFSAIFTIISVFAVYNYWMFFICRVIVGIAQGPLYPVVIQIMADYAPIEERTWLYLITHTGNIAALLETFLVGGVLVEYVVDGWKYVFFITGAMGVISWILWTIFVFDTPDQNPWMSKEEKDYISNSIYPDGKPVRRTLSSVPFIEIIKSPQLYHLTFAHFAKLLVLYMNLFGLVLFVKDYFAVSSLLAALLSSIPFSVDFICQLLFSNFVTFLKGRNMRITNIRRLNNFIGALGVSIFLIPVGFVSCNNVALGIILISLSLAFIPCFQAGYYIASVEIAPQFSLIVGSIVNMGGSFAGIFQRYLTGTLTENYELRLGYRYSFIITAILTFFCSMFFVIWGSADVQPWAKTKYQELPKKPKETESDANVSEVHA